jgi:hypothetical protein
MASMQRVLADAFGKTLGLQQGNPDIHFLLRESEYAVDTVGCMRREAARELLLFDSPR